MQFNFTYQKDSLTDLLDMHHNYSSSYPRILQLQQFSPFSLEPFEIS